MVIPKPLSRGRLVMGRLIHVPPGGCRDSKDRLEGYQQVVETSLTELGSCADAMCRVSASLAMASQPTKVRQTPDA